MPVNARSLLRFVPATAVLVLAGISVAGFAHSRRDWENIQDLIIAGVCVVAFFFSDEFSGFTGHYGWTRQQWLEYPVEAVRWIALVALAVDAWHLWHPSAR